MICDFALIPSSFSGQARVVLELVGCFARDLRVFWLSQCIVMGGCAGVSPPSGLINHAEIAISSLL